MRDPELPGPRRRAPGRRCRPDGEAVRPGADLQLAADRRQDVGTDQRRAELVGGIALATGKGRRLGAALLALSLVPTTIGKYPFWSRSDPAERAADRDHFLKNVSLLGGVLIASRDTEGRPSLGYRAQKGGQALAKNTNAIAADTKKAGRKVAKQTRELTDAATGRGRAAGGRRGRHDRQEAARRSPSSWRRPRRRRPGRPLTRSRRRRRPPSRLRRTPASSPRPRAGTPASSWSPPRRRPGSSWRRPRSRPRSSPRTSSWARTDPGPRAVRGRSRTGSVRPGSAGLA